MQNSSDKFYYYILQSLKDFSFYVGQCDDLDRSMNKHFEGMSGESNEDIYHYLKWGTPFDLMAAVVQRG